MSIINNCVSKIYKNDPICIIVYLDLTFTEDKQLETDFYNYVTEMTDNNPIFKQSMEKHNNTFVLKDIENFNVKDYVTIKYFNKNKFNSYLKVILKQPLVNDIFFVTFCIDKINQRARIFFKINHAYTDGYRLINMIVKPLTKKESIPEFKRTTNLCKTIYHYIIGTWTLLLMNIKIFIRLMYLDKQTNKSNDTDYIICKSFNLNKIKEVSKKNNCTVNDFLYSVMVKTDKLYTKKTRNIQTCCPINVTKISDINNICPILNCINNSLSDNTLLEKVHKTFDHFKYSLFIPFISFLINQISPYVSLDILTFLYDYLINSSDYIYSNVIGIPTEELNKNENIHIIDYRFFITTKMNETVFNIISCDDKINIICSFKKGRIKDKKRFEKCIYRAYNSLINIDNTGFA